MKKNKFSWPFIAMAVLIFGVSGLFTSCQDKDEVKSEIAKDNSSQMKAFENALKSLSSKENLEAQRSGRMSAELVFQNTLITEAKALIYTTGISEQELNAKYGGNNQAIIAEALKIHAKNANGKLNP